MTNEISNQTLEHGPCSLVRLCLNRATSFTPQCCTSTRLIDRHVARSHRRTSECRRSILVNSPTHNLTSPRLQSHSIFIFSLNFMCSCFRFRVFHVFILTFFLFPYFPFSHIFKCPCFHYIFPCFSRFHIFKCFMCFISLFYMRFMCFHVLFFPFLHASTFQAFSDLFHVHDVLCFPCFMCLERRLARHQWVTTRAPAAARHGISTHPCFHTPDSIARRGVKYALKFNCR